MATELILGEAAFAALADEWDALAERGMTDTPFQKLAYQRAWWTHLRPDGATLLTVAARDAAGELTSIGCFFNHEETLLFNGCVEETDYLDLIASAEGAAAGWAAVLDCIERADVPAWRGMELCNIPQNSPSRAVLAELARQRGYTFTEDVAEVCPIISLPETFDDYLEQLDSKQRREVSRKLRRAEAAGMTTTVVGLDGDIDAATARFLTLLQLSTFDKRDWLNEGRRALFYDVARAAQHDGTLQLMFTGLEGRDAAALFNFDYKGRVWVYNSGLDPAAFSALSPGVVLTAAAIERAITLGRDEFDFLRGDEAYKYRFGATDTTIYRLRLRRPE